MLSAALLLSAVYSVPSGNRHGTGDHLPDVVLLGAGDHVQVHQLLRSVHRLLPEGLHPLYFVPAAVAVQRGPKLCTALPDGSLHGLSAVVLHGAGCELCTASVSDAL